MPYGLKTQGKIERWTERSLTYSMLVEIVEVTCSGSPASSRSNQKAPAGRTSIKPRSTQKPKNLRMRREYIRRAGNRRLVPALGRRADVHDLSGQLR